MKVIEIKWEGPYTLEEVRSPDPNKTLKDHGGLYQIYGIHPLFGADSLLYIGKAGEQKFYQRVHQQDKGNWIDWDSLELKIFLGHFGGANYPGYDDWLYQINVAEMLLIYHLSPPFNSAGIKKEPEHSYGDLVIHNFGKRHRLPEKFFDVNYQSSLATNSWKQYPHEI
jgi:hypothetical protein